MVIEPKYQTIWRRVFASILDVLVLSPIIVPNYLAINRDFFPASVRIALAFLYLAVRFSYQISMHANYGQTVGKMIMKIKLVDAGGAPIGWLQASFRPIVDIFLAVSLLIIELPALRTGIRPANMGNNNMLFQEIAAVCWDGLVILILLGNEKRRSIPDFIARTVIVRTDPVSAIPEGQTKELTLKPVARFMLIVSGIFFSLLTVAGFLICTIDIFEGVPFDVAGPKFIIWAIFTGSIAAFLLRTGSAKRGRFQEEPE